MNLTRLASAALIFALCVTSANSIHADDTPSIKVTANIRPAPDAHNVMSGILILRVENISQKPILVHTMSCSWCDDWESDTPDIQLGGWNCAKNVPLVIEIPPGGYFTDTLAVVATHGHGKARSVFRVGFKPENFSDRIWSNEVTLPSRPTAPAPGFLPADFHNRQLGRTCQAH